jgi:hypothetical protein
LQKSGKCDGNIWKINRKVDLVEIEKCDKEKQNETDAFGMAGQGEALDTNPEG